MPPKKRTAGKALSIASGEKPAAKKAEAILANILPQIPQNPSQAISLETYEVDGKVWAMAASSMTILGLVDLQANVARKPPETVGKLMTFLMSAPDVQDTDPDGQWNCTRYLGSGAFGRVALLVKTSADGKILDTIALKEVDHMWINREAIAAEPNLPIEVAINRDLNTHDAVYTSYLRSYKYSLKTRCGRLYLRHYQYGDLDLLHKAYAIYGHWLPEWFLYELLRDFCKSLKALDQPPPADTKVVMVYPEGKEGDKSIFKTIHQDIKPENAFLDEAILKENVYDGVPARPVPVLADFGEADYTHLKDKKNPERLAGGGTPGYKPAEELRANAYLEDHHAGEQTFDDEEEDAMRPFPPTANNVWGIGRIAFEMMTHVRGTDFGRALKINEDLEDFDDEYEEFVASLKFSSKLKKWQEILSKCVHADLVDTFPYSDELRSLVADMLHPRPSKRPSIQDVERRAEKGLDSILNPADAGTNGQEDGKTKGTRKSKKASTAKKPKLTPLYYTQEQWANIPSGVVAWKEAIPKELYWLRHWARFLFAAMDPEGPIIKQPKFMKDNDEPWDRFSDTTRVIAIKSTDGKKVVPLRDVSIQRFKTPAEMERAAKKKGPAVKQSEATKRRRGAKDSDEANQPPKKKVSTYALALKPHRKLTSSLTTKAAGKGKVVEGSEEEDPATEDVEQELQPPAKRGNKAQPTASALKKQADKTTGAKDGQKVKQKKAAKQAEATQEADARTRSLRSKKTGVNYAE